MSERRYNRWTEEEKEILERAYPQAAKGDIANDIPNRSWKAICEMAHTLNLHRSYKAKGDAIRKGKERK